ncbi:MULTISPECIES: hypothetical protein [unclassified Enterococcus]|uniref:hypothetical protein n=1 Tax=unclassified Enterococcus TaxID=2608891 RepID=UPI0013EC01D6|nr:MULTISPECIES: hypothetical protein [unclassified Enterococcus]
MRAADLLTILANTPRKKQYQNILLEKSQKYQPLTAVTENDSHALVFVFEENKVALPTKDLLILLMKHREKEIYYQLDQNILPLYGVKELDNDLIV